MRWLGCLLAAWLVVLHVSGATAQGFAGMGTDAEGFAPVVPGHEIVFPRDHGPHPDHRIEWWYLTANLADAGGAPLGLQWTLFRFATAPGPQREGWENQQLWFAHAAVTTAGTHRAAETFSRGGIGQAGVEAEPFEAWIDDWSLRSTGDGFSPLRLTAGGEDFSYELTLEAEGPMVRQGDGGYSPKSERGQASYYVSQPFFRAEGRVTLDGQPRQVKGRAWMDREWSSQPLAPEQTGWDWFSLHLDGGDKLMAFRLRQSDGADYITGNWITADGESVRIPPGQIAMTPGETASVAGREMPVVWQIEVPERGVDIRTRPLNAQAWNDLATSYWEGPVTVSGSHGGEGYLEMTGY